MPLPSVIISDHDISAGPPIPGLHVTCSPLNTTTGLHAARGVVSILKYLADFGL